MTLLDQEISHITRAVRFSLCSRTTETVLPAAYWRRRLHQLLASEHLTKAQLAAIDSLLRELDSFDARNAESRSNAAAARRP